MARQAESRFGDKVDKWLKTLPYTWFEKLPAFKKGLPDRIGFTNGQGWALELKKDTKALTASKKGQKLQHHTLTKIGKSGAFVAKVSPENWESVQKVLEGFVWRIKR